MKWLKKDGVGLAVISIFCVMVGMSISTRFDFTSQSFFTLSSSSRSVLDSLKSPIRLVSFYKSGTYEHALVSATLGAYERNSQWISYRNIDPLKESIKMLSYNGADNGTIIVENRSGQRLLQPRDLFLIDDKDDIFKGEEAITNAILGLGDRYQSTVYFTEGNQEPSIYDETKSGLSELKQSLNQMGILTSSINPNLANIPKNCKTLIITSPKLSVSNTAFKRIETYLENGGRVLLFLDPFHKTGFESVLKSKGLMVHSSIVIDEDASYFLGSTSVVPQFNPHPLTVGSIETQEGLVLVQTKALNKAGNNNQLEYIPLLTSSETAWADSDDTISRKKRGTSLSGPFDLAVLLENTQNNNKEKWIVIGDSDLATNDYFLTQGNREFVLQLVTYLLDKPLALIIPSKKTPLPSVRVTDTTYFLLQLVLVVILPLMCLGYGVKVWRQYR